MITIEQDERCGLLSASGFERTHGPQGCKASFMLEKNLKEQGPKIAAKRGDKIHAVMEGRIPMTSLSYSDKICAERIGFEEGRLVEQLGFEGAAPIKEQRFWVKEHGKKLFSAKPDVVHVLSNRALIINFKTGFYPVTSIKQNTQMLAEMIATAFGGNFLFDTLSIALIHPNSPLEDGSISQHDTTGIVTAKFLLADFKQTAREVLRPDAAFNPSPKNCQFCLGRKQKCCPAIFGT